MAAATACGGSFPDRKRPSGHPQAVKRCDPCRLGAGRAGWSPIWRRKRRLGPCDGPSRPEGTSCCAPASGNLQGKAGIHVAGRLVLGTLVPPLRGPQSSTPAQGTETPHVPHDVGQR